MDELEITQKTALVKTTAALLKEQLDRANEQLKTLAKSAETAKSAKAAEAKAAETAAK